MKKLLIALEPDRVTAEHLSEIQRLADGYTVIVSNDDREILSHAADIEIVNGSISPELIAKLPNLRWYQQYGAGADWLLRAPEVAERDFLLTNTSGIHAIPITEHLMAFLLCFARGFKASILGQKDRVWEESRRQPLFELAGKRVVLVGVGAIGAHFAKAATAFGMEVVGVRRSAGAPIEGTIRVVSQERLDEELGDADFLVLTMPHTEETHHMIDARRLGLLKKGAYLINIGRGGTVDEPALIEALTSGHLAGAGLDVFETEPLPADSPLWDLESVILTPHYSGITPRYLERFMAIFIDNLKRFVQGEELANQVDMQRGY